MFALYVFLDAGIIPLRESNRTKYGYDKRYTLQTNSNLSNLR
ncbi:MAG: hypothetical protein ANABAC_0388 [Anaerolineae bacterium]|nr:MAG: hypothetical protein ANABAC_0388 [Anaerolineae bacterium]